MGALQHILDGQIPGNRPARKNGVGALFLTLLVAGAAGADDSSISVPDPAPEEPILEAQVSTSPVATVRPMIARPTLVDGPVTPARALTRAAAQKQVEEMTPMHWLSRFGAVTVDHTQ